VRPSTGGGVELDEAATRAELRREITRAPVDAVGTGPVRGGAASKSLQ
jgi:hypothetical protein